MVLAETSALDSTRKRETSRWPLQADLCSGVASLKKSKRINLRKQSFASFKKTIMISCGGKLLAVLCLHISLALQQQTAGFKVAIVSRAMQWSVST